MTHEQMQQASMKAANAALDVFEGIGIRVTSDAVRDAIASHFAPLCEKPKMIPVTDNDGAERLVEVEAEPQVIRKTAWMLPSVIEGEFITTTRPGTNSIHIPLISRDGGKTWQIDNSAKDAAKGGDQ